MATEALKDISKTRTEIESRTQQLLKILPELKLADGSSFDANIDVPSTYGSIHDLIVRLETSVGLTTILDSINKEKLILVPKNWINGINGTLQSINTVFQTILDELQNTINSGPIQKVQMPDIQLVNSQNAVTANLGKNLKGVDDHVDTVLHLMGRINGVVKARDVSPFSSAIAAIADLMKDIDKRRKEISILLKVSKSNSTKTETTSNTAAELAEKVQTLKAEAETSSQKIKESEVQATKLLEGIQTVNNATTQLKAAVEQYQGNFEEFRQKLDERNKKFEEGKSTLEELISTKGEELKTLISSTGKLRDTVAELEKEGRRMLGLTTAAGLAQSFHEARKGLRWQVVVAQGVFYFSIALLIALTGITLSAFPWLNDIIALPPVKPPTGATTGSAVLHIIGSVFVRFIILLPGLLLAGFAARWHKSLFRLREDYLFKETVASSVPGFKEEAPIHSPAMAAAAFERLLFNPADRLDQEPQSEKHEGGLSGWLKSVVKQAFKEMREKPNE